jgi:hypothetical protein
MAVAMPLQSRPSSKLLALTKRLSEDIEQLLRLDWAQGIHTFFH